MGSRALVAYQRPTGKFNVHYSHQGAADFELCHDITETTPLGGEADEPEYASDFLAGLEEGTADDRNATGYLTQPQEPTAVESEPELVSVPMSEAVEYTDTCNESIEVLYVVEQDFTVRAFRRFSLRVGTTDAGSILIEPRWYNGEIQSAGYDKGIFYGTMKTVESLVSDGILTEAEGIDRIREQMLKRMNDHTGQQILAHSTAISTQDYTEYLPAFLKPTGINRMSGEEVVSGFHDYEPWELPDDFPNPEIAKSEGSNKQTPIDLF